MSQIFKNNILGLLIILRSFFVSFFNRFQKRSFRFLKENIFITKRTFFKKMKTVTSVYIYINKNWSVRSAQYKTETGLLLFTNTDLEIVFNLNIY